MGKIEFTAKIKCYLTGENIDCILDTLFKLHLTVYRQSTKRVLNTTTDHRLLKFKKKDFLNNISLGISNPLHFERVIRMDLWITLRKGDWR